MDLVGAQIVQQLSKVITIERLLLSYYCGLFTKESWTQELLLAFGAVFWKFELLDQQEGPVGKDICTKPDGLGSVFRIHIMEEEAMQVFLCPQC